MSNFYWSESFLRPSHINDDVWQKILNNFLSQISDPITDLNNILEDDLERLEELGILNPTSYAALLFEIEQASDFGSLAERGRVGSMGQGWSSLADIKLVISEDGAKSIIGLIDTDLLIAMDATKTAHYAASLSIGRTIGQDGKLIDTPLIRPIFTTDRNTSNNITLTSITGGYEAKTTSGDKYVFDHLGKLISFISASGNQISAIYDSNDRISKYEDDKGGLLEFTYDSSGRLVSVEDGDGQISTFSYSVADELINIEDDRGETNFTYDSEGNLLTSQRVGGPELEFTYDVQGRLSTQTLGNLISEVYTYDNAGAITVTNGLLEEAVIQKGPGGTISSLTNNLHQTVSYTPDAEAKSLTIRLPDGSSTVLSYDTAGRLQTVKDGNNDAINFSYDSLTGKMISFTDAEEGVRTFDYDSAGRLINAEWADQTFLAYNYDSQGNLAEFTNRRGQTVEYEYDIRGRVTDASDSASGALSYTYDTRGNLASVTTTSGVTEISYDSADRVTLIEYPNGRSLAYTYDAEGKRLSMVNQDGEGTYYSYDAAGRLATVSDNGGVLTSYAYDIVGRLETETNANGTYTEYGYDSAGRLNEITNYDSATNVNSFFQYSFDLAGRKSQAVTNDGTWIYDYDAAGQLVEANFSSTTSGIPSTSIEYQYDSAGNRIATIENSVTTSYTTNNLNQYETAGGKSLTYDDDGNLIGQTETGNDYNYVYDIDNRLIRVIKPGNIVIDYEYDAFGNRSAVIENGVRTEFLVDPLGLGNIVAEYDALGIRTASYAHGIGLTSRTDAVGNHAFFDTDGSGSVIGLTDTIGNMANSYIYTPFGKELYESETISNAFEFHGSVGVIEDAENLLYMRARNYDVSLGRFLSEDPLYLNGDIANLYRFVNNDPVQLIDPTGEIGVSAVARLGGAAYNAGVLLPLAVEYYSSSDVAYRQELLISAGPYLASTVLGAGVAAGTRSPLLTDITFAGGLAKDAFDYLTGNANAAMGRGGRGSGGQDSDGDGRSDGGSGAGSGNGGGGGSGGSGEGSNGGGDDEDGGGGPTSPPFPGPDGMASPLVLDIDGDGIELYAAGDYGTYFDLLNNGQAVRTAWVDPDDGLLALDVNENGRIDNITELFGNSTTDGFSALRPYDTNSDGIIDANDTVFENLLVWQDANSDGVSQSSELKGLSELGILSINLNDSRLVDTFIEGNSITHKSTFTMTGNVERSIVDAWFNYQVTMTKNVADYTFDVRTAFLPTLRGYGNLKDLHIAASLDNGSALDTIMQQLIDLQDGRTFTDSIVNWSSIESLVDTLLLNWANVESVNSTGRGNYVDGRHLAFYEAFVGEPFSQSGRSNPLPEAGQFVEAIYKDILLHSATHLLAQIAGKEIFESPRLSLYTGGMTGDLSLRQSGIDAIKSEAMSAVDGAAVWARFAQFLGYTKGFENLTSFEISALDTAVSVSGIVGLNDWQDVIGYMTVNLGSVIKDPDDWGSFEMYYDNSLIGTSGDETITDPSSGGLTNNEILGLEGNDVLYGLDGHDKLRGGAGNDILYGGAGDDFMLGGTGDDIYVYETGKDTITEVDGDGHDELHIAASTGFTQTNIVDLYRYNNDLMIMLSSGDYITISDYQQNRIEKIVFDFDSSEIDLETLISNKFYGTAYADRLTVTGESFQDLLVYGYEGNDVIKAQSAVGKFYGGDGYDDLIGDYLNDELYGENGDDYLKGNDGNDFLGGGDGNDWLEGGAGNDNLRGDDGDDTFLFGIGDGNDVIKNSAPNESLGDRVVFKEGVSANDIVFARTQSEDRHITFIIESSGDSLKIEDQFGKVGNNTFYLIPKFEFADGTVWSDQDIREKYVLDNTTSGNDVVVGFDWNETYLSSSGDDLFYDKDGEDSYYWTSTSGNDTINDFASIGTYNGDGDVLNFSGLAITDLTFSKVGNNLLISNINAQNTLTIINQFLGSYYGLETFVFSGQTLLRSAIQSLATTGTTINGNASNNLLNGTTGDDLINGLAGSDIINAYEGNDTVNGGDGYDIINAGTGNDIINADDGDDIAYGGTGIDEIYGGAGHDSLYGENDSDTIEGGYGNDYIEGGAGNDFLYGEDDNDVIYGSVGNDLLHGGAGDDVYYFTRSDDQDILLDASGTNDVIKLVDNTNFDSITLSVVNTDDLKIAFSATATEYVTITDQFDTLLTNQIEKIELRDGFWLDLTRYNDWVFGTGSSNTINGDAGSIIRDDIILGRSGVDTIRGYGGEDHISGDAGADRLYGGDEDDWIIGGAGNDDIYGDADNDHLFGDSGDDDIWGGAGDDYISGGSGEDILYGEAGADIFAFEGANLSVSDIDTISDWDASDSIKLSDVLIGFDPLSSAISDFVNFTTFGVNSVLSVDRDGQGSVYAAQSIASITNVTGLDAEALYTNGKLIL